MWKVTVSDFSRLCITPLRETTELFTDLFIDIFTINIILLTGNDLVHYTNKNVKYTYAFSR